MEEEKIKSLFEDFLKSYNVEKKEKIWREKRDQFRSFWNTRIINDTESLLDDEEIDIIIRILDSKAKGHTKETEAVAMVMIPQGVWRRMFNEIKKDSHLKNALNKIFLSNAENIIAPINELYKINKERKNSLTGKSGNAINTMNFVYNPDNFLSMVSLNDRKKAIEYFCIPTTTEYKNGDIGVQMFYSNKIILDWFRNILGENTSPRTISDFLYSSLKNYWKGTEQENKEQIVEPGIEDIEGTKDPATFYMEKELENFIIENWEKTELGKKYDLINDEEGEVASQQYRIGNNKIDILVKDKKNEQYVVIELKKNKTSDQVFGQLARYMGWIEEHESKGKSVKGIIIAPSYDKNLDYALRILKKSNDVEVYVYQIDFKLNEFKGTLN